MEAGLNFQYDREADILHIDTCLSYARPEAHKRSRPTRSSLRLEPCSSPGAAADGRLRRPPLSPAVSSTVL